LWKKYEKSEKKRRRKKEEKGRKREEKKKNGISKTILFPYLRRGHQFDHVSREVQYKKEELKTTFNKITSIFLHYTNI
jgi:hypothetical protein